MYGRCRYSLMGIFVTPWKIIALNMVGIVLSGHEMTFPGGIDGEVGMNGRNCLWYSRRIRHGDSIWWMIYMAVHEICVAQSHFITPLDDKVFTATVMINCWCRDTYSLDINEMSLVTCNLDSIIAPQKHFWIRTNFRKVCEPLWNICFALKYD